LLLEHKDISDIPLIPDGSGKLCADPRQWGMVKRLMDAEWFSRV
jgi:hypothetical protein